MPPNRLEKIQNRLFVFVAGPKIKNGTRERVLYGPKVPKPAIKSRVPSGTMTGSGYIGLNWVELGCIGLNWIELGCIGLNWVELG